VTLEADAEALPWPERRAIVELVATWLKSGSPPEPAIALLRLLSEDSKWEVRKEAAECLVHVPDDSFPQLAAQLAQDANQFVRTAAERALARRRRGEQSTQRKRRGLDQAEARYADFEQVHGAAAAKQARAIADQRYETLVSSTVHDMRGVVTPLKSGILGLQRRVAAGELDPAQLGKHLDRLTRHITLLERILDDMRAYVQPTPLQRYPERLADVVAEVHHLLLEHLHSDGCDPSPVTISLNVPEDLVLIVARHQMVRVLTNVMKNAVEAFAVGPDLFEPGEVHVEAQRIDDVWAEIIVRDNGMGLSAEELAEVRRFGPGGSSKKQHGTGFGLPIAKRKVEGHGGWLTIESKEDHGTTVRITLPMDPGGQAE
jgi:signal transduction histidine kinase